MDRTNLLAEVVELDGQIVLLTSQAAHAINDREFDRIISEVRALREKRANLQAQLDALGK
jgi:hypothetical protein